MCWDLYFAAVVVATAVFAAAVAVAPAAAVMLLQHLNPTSDALRTRLHFPCLLRKHSHVSKINRCTARLHVRRRENLTAIHQLSQTVAIFIQCSQTSQKSTFCAIAQS